jgi:hypothetical protein
LTNKEQVYVLMELFWSVDNQKLQDLIVRDIYDLIKEDMDNEL